jgi:two-component sensor histidine kinase
MRPTISDSFERATAISHYEVAHSKRNASLELLVRELQHRIRNLLTVVQCFVNSTEARTADDYRVALMARIANLSDAYNLIESERGNRVSLAELLERTLKPHVTFLKDRILVGGPD